LHDSFAVARIHAGKGVINVKRKTRATKASRGRFGGLTNRMFAEAVLEEIRARKDDDSDGYEVAVSVVRAEKIDSTAFGRLTEAHKSAIVMKRLAKHLSSISSPFDGLFGN
jgi:hypothetical protein